MISRAQPLLFSTHSRFSAQGWSSLLFRRRLQARPRVTRYPAISAAVFSTLRFLTTGCPRTTPWRGSSVEQGPMSGCEPAPRTPFPPSCSPSCSAQLSTPPPQRPPSLLKRLLREQIHPTQCSSAFLRPLERTLSENSSSRLATGSTGTPRLSTKKDGVLLAPGKAVRCVMGLYRRGLRPPRGRWA